MNGPQPRRDETDRQFRVVSQMISMHSALRDRYNHCALALDLVLLSCSVVFCATMFASPEGFACLGLKGSSVGTALKIASVAAFFASLAGLRVDWKGRAARHEDSVRRLGQLLQTYRGHRREDGTWADPPRQLLSQSYRETMGALPAIPERQFLALKAKHIRKLQVSEMLDRHPGCPVLVLRAILLFSSSISALRGGVEASEGEDDAGSSRPQC